MTTLAVCVTVLVLWASMRPLVERLVSVLESRTAFATRPASPAEEVAMPSDLEQLARAESEVWAREQVKRSVLEAYHEATGTTEERWEKVRTRFRLNLSGEA